MQHLLQGNAQSEPICIPVDKINRMEKISKPIISAIKIMLTQFYVEENLCHEKSAPEENNLYTG